MDKSPRVLWMGRLVRGRRVGVSRCRDSRRCWVNSGSWAPGLCRGLLQGKLHFPAEDPCFPGSSQRWLGSAPCKPPPFLPWRGAGQPLCAAPGPIADCSGRTDRLPASASAASARAASTTACLPPRRPLCRQPHLHPLLGSAPPRPSIGPPGLITCCGGLSWT